MTARTEPSAPPESSRAPTIPPSPGDDNMVRALGAIEGKLDKLIGMQGAFFTEQQRQAAVIKLLQVDVSDLRVDVELLRRTILPGPRGGLDDA